MRIESGTTRERVVRCLIFLVVCGALAIYFAYDGYVGYPKKNLEQARKNFPKAVSTLPQANPNVTAERFAQLQADLPRNLDEITDALGEPAYQDQKDAHFVGRYGVIRATLDGRRVSGLSWQKLEKSHADILFQQGAAYSLALLTLVTLVQFFRILRTHVVLDDEGLAYNSRRVTWDQMTSLVTDKYHDKGWVDLAYKKADGTEHKLRLDSYKIKAFDEIISALCQRKGFTSPIAKPPAPDEPGGGPVPRQPRQA